VGSRLRCDRHSIASAGPLAWETGDGNGLWTSRTLPAPYRAVDMGHRGLGLHAYRMASSDAVSLIQRTHRRAPTAAHATQPWPSNPFQQAALNLHAIVKPPHLVIRGISFTSGECLADFVGHDARKAVAYLTHHRRKAINEEYLANCDVLECQPCLLLIAA